MRRERDSDEGALEGDEGALTEPATGQAGPREVRRPPSADPEVTPGYRRGIVELHEERLTARKEKREAGEVVIRKVVDEHPERLEVEAIREEAEVEHVPVGRYVDERRPPWEEDGCLVVPVYEEQLVVVKRLLLREKIRIRRVKTRERQVHQDTLRKERIVVEGGEGRRLGRERYASPEPEAASPAARRGGRPEEADQNGSGFFDRMVRRAFLE
jgi:uncharacterized protein (TIGR02271 family)